MNDPTWIDWLGRGIGVADFVLWCCILKMHLKARWTNEARAQAAERKARLDREKRQGPSAESIRARAAAKVARKEIDRIKETAR